MPRFLSPAWVDAVNAATAEMRPAPDVAVVVDHVVCGGPDGDVRYRMQIAGGRVLAALDSDGPADVVLKEDYDTAVAMARGELTAQEAVAAGRLKLAGNTDALVRHAAAIAALGGVLAAVRATTDY